MVTETRKSNHDARVWSLKCPLAPPPPFRLPIPTPQNFYPKDGTWRALNSTPNLGFTPLGLPRPGLRVPTRFYNNARRARCSGRGTRRSSGVLTARYRLAKEAPVASQGPVAALGLLPGSSRQRRRSGRLAEDLTTDSSGLSAAAPDCRGCCHVARVRTRLIQMLLEELWFARNPAPPRIPRSSLPEPPSDANGRPGEQQRSPDTSVLPLPPSPTGTSAPGRREGSSLEPRAPRCSPACRGRLPTGSRAAGLSSLGWRETAGERERGTRPRLLRSAGTRKVVPNLGGAGLCAAFPRQGPVASNTLVKVSLRGFL